MFGVRIKVSVRGRVIVIVSTCVSVLTIVGHDKVSIGYEMQCGPRSRKYCIAPFTDTFQLWH